MADQQRPLPNAPFPAPPPFWKHFTAENVAKLKAIEDAAEHPGQAIVALPLELQYLRPPSPPPEQYTIFGEEQTLSASLPSLGDLQLFPEPLPSGGHAFYLTKITKSILLNFLELTTILSANPSAATPKLEDIKRLFLNAHHLINMYRPHQARETLIMMMEEQLEEGSREMEECERVRRKVEESLREMEGLGKDSEAVGERDVNGVGGDSKAKERDDMQHLWQTIHELDHDQGSMVR